MADSAAATMNEGGLANWAPSRRLSLSQARKRSARVKWLRTGFLALSVGSAAILVGTLAGNAIQQAGSGRTNLSADETVTMLNPRFSGRDAFARAYVLTADTAQRQRASQDVIELINPRLVDDMNRVVTAPRGLYDQQSQTLELFESVRAEEGEGYVFTSTHAKFFVADGRVEGVAPLEGSGPIGDVRADTYEILEDGASIRLKGRVRTVLYPKGRDQQGDE